MRTPTLLSALALTGLIVACSNQVGLAPATFETTLDTITLGALYSTPPSIPSAYSIHESIPVFTNATSLFDFAYDVDSVLGPVLLPAQVTGVYYPAATNPGLQRASVPFDSVKRAPSNGYIIDHAVAIDTGDVIIGRSLIHCNIGVPEYAKLKIVSIDSAAHTVTFYIVVDNNCGYRGLQPGIPTD